MIAVSGIYDGEHLSICKQLPLSRSVHAASIIYGFLRGTNCLQPSPGGLLVHLYKKISLYPEGIYKPFN